MVVGVWATHRDNISFKVGANARGGFSALTQGGSNCMCENLLC